jgi:hypothetical protein
MKKVLTIVVASAFVSLTSCNNAPATEPVIEEVVVTEEVAEGEEEVTEEVTECPAK